jgi:ABC-2 type transport system permease protein
VTAVPAKALFDGAAVAKRNLIKIKRVPEVLVFVLISPLVFVLLFAYVFGDSIEIPGVGYRSFLLPGIFVQTVVFGATFTGAGIAEDMQKGIIDRFRSLPMSRSAVLVGRTGTDVVYNLLSIVVMSLTGLVVGWRIQSSFLDALGGYLLLLAFAYAFSWVMAYVGLLRTFAEWNPVSAVAQAAREAFGNTSPLLPEPEGWPLQHPVAYTLVWVGIILAVFVPLSTRQYRRAASR